MGKNHEKQPGAGSDGQRFPKFKTTLPLARSGRKKKDQSDEGVDLDLDLGDIQSRLPYGSEDIADK